MFGTVLEHFGGSPTSISRGASPPDLSGNLYPCTYARFIRFLTLRNFNIVQFQGLNFLFRSFLFVYWTIGARYYRKIKGSAYHLGRAYRAREPPEKDRTKKLDLGALIDFVQSSEAPPAGRAPDLAPCPVPVAPKKRRVKRWGARSLPLVSPAS